MQFFIEFVEILIKNVSILKIIAIKLKMYNQSNNVIIFDVSFISFYLDKFSIEIKPNYISFL